MSDYKPTYADYLRWFRQYSSELPDYPARHDAGKVLGRDSLGVAIPATEAERLAALTRIAARHGDNWPSLRALLEAAAGGAIATFLDKEAP